MSSEVADKVNGEDATINGDKADDAKKVEDSVDIKEENKDVSEDGDGLNKTGEDEEENEEDEEAEEEEEDEERRPPRDTSNSLYVKLTGVKRQTNLGEDIKLYHEFFTKELGVEAPLIQIPGPEDIGIFFQMKTIEDRDTVMKKVKESKRGTYTWNKYFVNVRVVGMLEESPRKVYERLPLEEALDTLYPYRKLPYHEQLAKKEEFIGGILKDVFTKEATNKKHNLTPKPIVPMVPIDGSDNNVFFSLEEDPETHEVYAGLRAYRAKKLRFVPVDQCLSVPRQMAIVIKNFVEELPNIGLKAFNPETREGDILGIGFRMTAYAKYIMSLTLPKVEKRSFIPMIDEDGELIKEEVLDKAVEESFSALTQKRIDGVKEKLTSYFENHGKALGIESVHVRFAGVSSLFTNREDPGQLMYRHILGSPHASDSINGFTYRLFGIKDRSVECLRSLMGLIEANTVLGPNTKIYLLSNYVVLGLFLAKKVGHVTMVHYWTKENLKECQEYARMAGTKNMDIVSSKFRPNINANYTADNTIVLVWKSNKPSLVQRFLSMGLTNFVFVNYFTSPVITAAGVKNHLKILEYPCNKLRVHAIYPIDTTPYKKQFAVAVFFSSMRARPTKPLGPRPTTMAHRVGPPRLGGGPAVPGPRSRLGGGFGNRPASNRAHPGPNPWSNSQTSMFDQVASGVMQNLQVVTQQIQSILPAGQQMGNSLPPWSAKRRLGQREDYSEDEQWGGRGGNARFGKRPREDDSDYNRWSGNKGSGWGGANNDWSRDVVSFNSRSGGSNAWSGYNY